MPDRNDRVKENVAGTYYVDSSCIDCDVCRDTAPENFRRSDANSYSFVYKQPLTEEERVACEEALLCCLESEKWKIYFVFRARRRSVKSRP